MSLIEKYESTKIKRLVIGIIFIAAYATNSFDNVFAPDALNFVEKIQGLIGTILVSMLAMYIYQYNASLRLKAKIKKENPNYQFSLEDERYKNNINKAGFYTALIMLVQCLMVVNFGKELTFDAREICTLIATSSAAFGLSIFLWFNRD